MPPMQVFEQIEQQGAHEQVVFCCDPTVGYRAIIAIHSTRLGPATGGTRLREYATVANAIDDALQLSRAMTYKAALAGLPAGGGKSVILEPKGPYDKAGLLRAHGRAIEALGGRYVTAVDVGVSPDDLEHIARETRHVALHRTTRGAGGEDTARGVLASMRAVAHELWETTSLSGKRVAVQGCGNVGRALVAHLRADGACVAVSDIDADRARAVCRAGAEFIDPARILEWDADVLAPCALGQTITRSLANRMRASAIVGGANNQLARDDVSEYLAERGVIYVPDFVANAGGMIAGVCERTGEDLASIHHRIDAIHETTRLLLVDAARRSITPLAAARDLAEEILAAGPGRYAHSMLA